MMIPIRNGSIIMTGAQFLADTLAAYDVTHVFFVPAILSHTLAELEKRTKIQRILTHGEKAAVYMADGYARATGKPGVAFAQCIGAANLAAGLRDAYLACSPLVVLTGGPYPETRGRHYYQQTEDLPLFRPLTKYSARVDTAARLPDTMRQAFREATSGTPGPAHVEIAGHLGELEQEKGELEVIAEPRFARAPAFRPLPEPESVREALAVLRGARRPVLVAGGGARVSGAGAEVIALAERLGIPIATSLNAKDLVPGEHPLNIGVPGQYSRKSANQALLEADCVFFVGSHTGSQVTFKWRVPRPGTTVVQLDINPAELGRHYANRVSLLGDVRETLRVMLAQSDDCARERAAWLARVRELAAAWRAEVRGVMASDAVPLRPERLCAELSRWLPDETLVVSETGHAGMWTGAFLDLRSGQGYVRAAGSLGWGLPAALGAKLACPERPVLLFSGDGGFWYHIGELETAVRWNIPAVLLVNNNRSLNMEIDLYADAYGGQLAGRHAELWKFSDVSLARVAEAMGAVGLRVERAGEIEGALARAFACGRPCVVEVMTEVQALAPVGYVGELKTG
jgi:acetolactate synthase-1/2/3 large subunit